MTAGAALFMAMLVYLVIMHEPRKIEYTTLDYHKHFFAFVMVTAWVVTCMMLGQSITATVSLVQNLVR